ncbi:hypothetical protein [Sphingopyxis fribergensis]
MNYESSQHQPAARAFPINLIPDAQDFASASTALDGGEEGYGSGTYFQHYIALIAACVQRGHRSVLDIMAQVAPLVGAQNAAHVPWLIEILSGPACDVHLWDWEGHEAGRYFYGPSIELKPELESLASAQA